jgi:hypothetical protein
VLHRVVVVLSILLSLVAGRHAVADDSPARATSPADFDPRVHILFRVEGFTCPAVSGLG